MTTEEQVAAVRAQVERERLVKPEAWWQHQAGNPAAVLEKRSRVVRFANERPAVGGRRTSAQGAAAKKRSVVTGGAKGSSSRRDRE